MPWRRITLALAAIAVVAVCACCSRRRRRSPRPPIRSAAGILSSLGGLVGGVFSSIGHAVLGAFTWTISLAAKFILTTIAALVKLLIPASWVHKGLQIMEWIVAVPNYAGKITSPSGGTHYGFAGINALRDLFMWLGVAVAPLTLVYATTRAMLGEREPVAIPVLRVLAVAGAVILYPYLWSAGRRARRPGHAHDPEPARGQPRALQADGLRRRRRRARRLAADRPRADGRDRARAARADLPQGRDHPARRAAVRDRAADDRPGRDRVGRRARAGVGERGRDAARPRDRAGPRCSPSARC